MRYEGIPGAVSAFLNAGERLLAPLSQKRPSVLKNVSEACNRAREGAWRAS